MLAKLVTIIIGLLILCGVYWMWCRCDKSQFQNVSNYTNLIKTSATPINNPTLINDSKKDTITIPKHNSNYAKKKNLSLNSMDRETENSNNEIVSADSITESSSDLPNVLMLIKAIKQNYLSKNYKFNLTNLPVTARHPNSNSKLIDKKYIKYLTKSINEWNNVLDSNSKHNPLIRLVDVNLLLVSETSNEFMIRANIKLFYQFKTFHLFVIYYGKIESTDDFLNGGCDSYILQLVDMQPLHETDYNTKQSVANGFLTMQQQMNYVAKINQMHENEN